MKMRETERIIDLRGRKWKFHKLSPLEGSNLLRKFVRGGNFDPQSFLSLLSDQEFASLQKTLLNVVYEVKEVAGKDVLLPVFNGDKLAITFERGDEAFMVTAISLSFNLQGFFEENASKEFETIIDSLHALNPAI
jgi:hypothetical protein